MNFAMVINVYIDVDETLLNPFDHPTNLDRFEKENTLRATVESINELQMTENDRLRIYIIAAATQENTKFDEKIRILIGNCFNDSNFELLTITNSDISSLKDESGSKFISGKGYPELRNLGFILPSIMNEDIIIQIDDDELVRPQYISKLKEVLNEHPDKYIFTAPYEKNGTVRIITKDPLKSWKKFSPMDKDMVKFFVESNDVKESLFGFGGNMAIRREFAEQVLYPLEVPRGEDFSMLLASRLVFENGNPLALIEKGNKVFKSYFVPFDEMTIIHKPPFEAKKEFLNYFENNMTRFIMEWGIFIKQNGLTIKKMKDLSYYINEMIGYTDIKKYLTPIFEEMLSSYPHDKIEEIKNRLLKLVDHYMESDRWEDYKNDQKLYIETLKRLKTESFKQLIINKGSVNNKFITK